MPELTNGDYKNILQFYKIQVPRSTRLLKKKAENIMATKLCKCIKKLDPENEAKSIGICTKTIVSAKGYKRGNFKCKTNRSIKLKKGGSKTRKNLL